MKLKCDKHNRRVLTVGDKFEHRTGDLSPCDSPSATIRDSSNPDNNKTFAIRNGELLRVVD